MAHAINHCMSAMTLSPTAAMSHPAYLLRLVGEAIGNEVGESVLAVLHLNVEIERRRGFFVRCPLVLTLGPHPHLFRLFGRGGSHIYTRLVSATIHCVALT